MRILPIYIVFKPRIHLLLDQRDLYLHPVSSAKATLSSRWSHWETRPCFYVRGDKKNISFGSSSLFVQEITINQHKTDTVSSSREEMWLLRHWPTSPQGYEVLVWGQTEEMCHWNGRNVI